jgi:23S rRNA pseudouridine2605 synthase
MRKVGLARALSKLGYCSRSQGAELIRAGGVRVNGLIRRNPEWPIHLERDRLEIGDVRVRTAERIYLMLNKPRGAVTTTADEKGRGTVYDLLPPDLPWVVPVGRLDKASEGLLLLTNDTEWAQRVLNPNSHIGKTYHVQVTTADADELVAHLRAGVMESGERLRARKVERLRGGAKNSWLEITLDEGKNRQIRRMMKACGVGVLRLVRVAIGPVALGELAKGSVRQMSAAERKALGVTVKNSEPGTDGSRHQEQTD